MAIACADCGCLVAQGLRLTTCDDPDCCCRDLPISKPEHGNDQR